MRQFALLPLSVCGAANVVRDNASQPLPSRLCCSAKVSVSSKPAIHPRVAAQVCMSAPVETNIRLVKTTVSRVVVTLTDRYDGAIGLPLPGQPHREVGHRKAVDFAAAEAV
jgi:hypothetical protein